MSEKKWSCKWKGSGRRGRTHKGKEYPRHTLKYFDGTHLGMRKRIFSKSAIHSVYREGRPALQSKYIIGLLNKFVGKTYEEFKFTFDQKTKTLFKKYCLPWCKLEDYLHDSEKEAAWHEEFYVDADGFIRKCKQVKRHLWRSIIKKKHISYNGRVELPDWGEIRTDPKFAANVGYCEAIGKPMPPQFREPLLLGEFYVAINRKVYKLPVYTCNQEMFVNYFHYRDREYDWRQKKYIYTPFWESNMWPIKYNKKKAYRIAQEWVKVEVKGIPYSQDHFIRMENISYADYKNRIATDTKQLEKTTDPLEKGRLIKELEYYKEKIESMPKVGIYNMGYGRYYTFVKRSDYEREVKKLVEKNQPH